jgi:hypothetical protein
MLYQTIPQDIRRHREHGLAAWKCRFMKFRTRTHSPP